MATDLNIAGISRSGVQGNYSYSVIGSPNKPVSYVDWGDAARFVNWLHNGQPIGAQSQGSTENGAYSLRGANSQETLNAVSRNAGARWFIPSENEWYKSAYHQLAAQGGDVDNYWGYATRTNIVPKSDQPPGDPSIQTNVCNYYNDTAFGIGYNAGYAVSGSTTYQSSRNYLTDVGAYTSAPSPYGTFDQGGNVFEWNEALILDAYRGERGGAWANNWFELQSSERSYYLDPTDFGRSLGFRVATLAGPQFPGDVNFDNVVDFTDLGILLNNYNQVSTFASGDFDYSGMVDFTDLGILLNNYNQSAPTLSPVTAVPEPTTAVLAIFACASMWLLKKRLK